MRLFWIVTFCIIILLLLIIICDTNRIVTVIYKQHSNKLAKNIRIIFLSDLHNKKYGKNNKQLLTRIRTMNPDILIIGGDMVTATPGKKCEQICHFINKLSSEYITFSGEGNHELRMRLYPNMYFDMYEKYKELLADSACIVLQNASYILSQEKIKITGLSVDKEYYNRFKKKKMTQEYLTRKIGNPSLEFFNILLAHNPEYYEDYDTWGADLVLSGHTHGGLIKIPFLGGLVSPSFRLFPKYDGGMKQGKKGNIIISRGLGTHTIPIRLFNPCELVCIDLEKDIV